MKGLKGLEKYKKTIAVIIFFASAIYLYNMFGPSFDPSEGEGRDAGADLVALSAKLDKVKLDSNVFTSRVYKSLSDFAADVPSQPVGRTNPFGVLGQ